MLLFSYLYLQNLGEGVMAPWLPLPAPLTRKVQFYALGMIQKSLECYSSSHRHHANSFPFFTHCRCHLPVFWGFTFAIVLLIEQRKTWWIQPLYVRLKSMISRKIFNRKVEFFCQETCYGRTLGFYFFGYTLNQIRISTRNSILRYILM